MPPVCRGMTDGDPTRSGASEATAPDATVPAGPRSDETVETNETESERSLAPVMGAVYVVAGIAHFLIPRRFAAAVPPSFPRPVGLVYLSGVAEILLGIGVAWRRTRRPSAWGIAALLVAVFPANLHLARGDVLRDLVPDRLVGPARLAALVRLPFQGVLIAWALRYARSEEEAAAES